MNISGYIPSRNRTQVAFPERSFEEMSLGPSLLLSQEKAQKSEIESLGADISNNSYYLDADDKNVAPIVESLQKEADSLATEAATKGYDPMLSNKLIAFRRKYQKALSQNEPWGKAVINYKDATAQWKQWEEAHKNDPQEFKQKAKKYFFGQYQGAVDDETPGQLRGFDAGSLPNYYDVNKDIREALKDATGKIGQVVGSEGSSIKIDTSSGVPMLRVFNSNTGQYMDNLQPLLAGAQAVLDDYSGGYGADTDRARFAKVQGITPEYLANTVGNITKSQRDSYYSQLPSSSGSYQGIPQYGTNKRNSSTPTQGTDFLQYGTLEAHVDDINKKYDKWNAQLDSKGNLKPLDNTPINAVGDARGAVSGLAPGFTSFQPTYNPRESDWKDLQTTYKNFYDSTHSTGGLTLGNKHYIGDRGFLELAKEADIAKTAIRGTDLGINNPQFSSSIWFLASQIKGQPTFIKANEYGQIKPSSLTKEDVEGKKINAADLMYKVDADGRLKTIIDDQEYIVNPEVLPRNIQGFDKNTSELVNIANDFGLTKERIDSINSTDYRVGNNVYRWQIDSENPLKRSLYQVQIDQNNQYQVIPVYLSTVQAESAKQKYMSAAPLKYKPEYITE